MTGDGHHVYLKIIAKQHHAVMALVISSNKCFSELLPRSQLDYVFVRPRYIFAAEFYLQKQVFFYEKSNLSK